MVSVWMLPTFGRKTKTERRIALSLRFHKRIFGMLHKGLHGIMDRFGFAGKEIA